MNPTADQKNHGLTILHDKPCGGMATIVATGVGRSGTTMLGRIMAGIGIKMTKNISPRTVDDKLIQQLVKDDNVSGLEQLCRQYDDKFKKWGFKASGLRRDLAKFAAVMRAPRFIIVTRDPIAVAVRNQLTSKRKMTAEITEAAQATASLLQQLGALKHPTLLVSYEKALQYPDATVKAVANFCGVTLDEAAARRTAKEAIMNGDPRFFGNPAAPAAPQRVPPRPGILPPVPKPVATASPRPVIAPPPSRTAPPPLPPRPVVAVADRPPAPQQRPAVLPAAPGTAQPLKRG